MMAKQTRTKNDDAAAEDDLMGSAPGGSLTDALKVSMATKLVELAERDYHFGCSPEGKVYAIPKTGPQIVRQLKGGRQSLRAELARKGYLEFKKAPSQTALAEALGVLEGLAQQAKPEELHVRVAEWEGRLVIDMGDQTGRFIAIGWDKWDVFDNKPPVLFRRTALTSPLPTPVRGGDLSALYGAINVAEKYRPVLLAVMVAALMPDIPHPVLVVSGEHGTAKSTTTKRIASIIDPSPAELRKQPKDVDAWVTAAAGSWVVALDNLSGIPDWLSDSLCRASTGEGDVRRTLYGDDDLTVFAFRRCVIVNGIDLGDLRGDLADRMVRIELECIPDTKRREDKKLAKEWEQAHPQVLGALLDLAVKVLAAMPTIELDRLPRMADFARVLAAVDQVLGTDGMSVYLALRDDLTAEVADSDAVLKAIAERIPEAMAQQRLPVWRGTAGDLLWLLNAGRIWTPQIGTKADRNPWPNDGRALTGRLTRLAPTMRALGWKVEKLGKEYDPRHKQNMWELVPPPAEQVPTPPGAQPTAQTNGQAPTQPYGPAPQPAAMNGQVPPACSQHYPNYSGVPRGDAAAMRQPSI